MLSIRTNFMSRSDWIASAVTLIGIALSYYLSGPKTAMLCGVVGTSILVVMMLRKSTKAKPDTPSQSLQQNANPVMTQTANPTVNVNTGNQPNPLPPPAPVAPIPQSNIRYVETREIDSYSSDDKFIETAPGLGSFCVAIACFRNDAIVGQRVQQPTLTAHIIYPGWSRFYCGKFF